MVSELQKVQLAQGAVTDVRPNGAGGAGGSFTVRLDAPANLWGALGALLVCRELDT